MKTADGTHNYTYDKVYQVISAVYPKIPKTNLTYDALGNRINADGAVYNPNNLNQYTKAGTTTFSYDKTGNMISRLETTGTTTYGWDYENHLTKVTTPNKGTVSYKYDYMGRKIERNENNKITRYVYDGDRAIAETDVNGSITSTYLYGTRIDEILQRKSGSTIYYYDYDGLGSVAEIADSLGKLIEKYDYDIWGNFTIKDITGKILSATTTGNNFYFTGRDYDFITGLYNYRARWYDAKIGRFISADPIKYKGGINVYAYVGNNPVNWIDPFGLCRDLNGDGKVNGWDTAVWVFGRMLWNFSTPVGGPRCPWQGFGDQGPGSTNHGPDEYMT